MEYTLTRHGISLNEALRPLGAWGKDRIKRTKAPMVTGQPAPAPGGGGNKPLATNRST